MATEPPQRAVVCAIDGTYITGAVAGIAAAFAARLGCPLELMYMADADDARLERHSLALDPMVELEDPATALIERARNREAQLLVLASHGDKQGGGALGGIFRLVVRQSPCPVVVVPPGAATMLTPLAAGARRLPVIVCGVDEQHAVRTLLFAADLAVRLQAGLVLVHATDAPLPSVRQQAWLDAGIGIASDQGVRVVTGKVAAGHPADAVRAAAESEQADLIVVASGGSGRLRSTRLGSVSAELSDAAGTPVALLPAGAHIAPASGHYELSAQGAVSPVATR